MKDKRFNAISCRIRGEVSSLHGYLQTVLSSGIPMHCQVREKEAAISDSGREIWLQEWDHEFKGKQRYHWGQRICKVQTSWGDEAADQKQQTLSLSWFCLATSFNLSWKDLYTEDWIFIGHWEFSPNWGSSLFSSTSSALPQPVKMRKRIHSKMVSNLTELYFFPYWKKINQEWVSRDFSLQFLLIRESKYPKTIPI